MFIVSKRLVLGVLVLVTSYVKAAVTLDSNETLLTYTFSNLVSTTENTGTSPTGNPYDVSISIGSPGSGSCDMRWYADYDSPTPFRTIVRSYDSSTYRSTSSDLSNWKTDLEGRIELVWLSGSRSISYIKIIIRDPNGNYFSQTMNTPDSLLVNTTNGTPYIWLYNLGYRGDFESFDLEDPDNDKFLNWQEYIADTNPNNGSDFLSIRMSGTDLTFDSSSACLYNILYCDDLIFGSWNSLNNDVSGDGTEMSITPSLSNPERYYKISAERKP